MGLLFLTFPPESPATTSVAEGKEEEPREDIALKKMIFLFTPEQKLSWNLFLNVLYSM